MMLPLGRIAREWRRVLIPLGLLAALNVIVYGVVVYPMSVRADTAEARADVARESLARARAEHAAAQTLVKSSDIADADLRRFYGDVLPSDLTAARRMTYARLAELARETNLLYGRRSFEPDDSYKGALDRLRITMELEGDYRDIREFVYHLESAPEFVVIEDMALSSGADENAPLALTLRLATYFRTGGAHGD